MGVPLSVARGVRLPGEAWLPRDWALAQAAAHLQKMRCSGCGHWLWEAFDPALKWRADDPVRCNPCTVTLNKQEQYQDAPAPQALRFTASRVG